MMNKIKIAIGDKQLQMVKQHAENEDVSIAEIIRRAIYEYLSKSVDAAPVRPIELKKVGEHTCPDGAKIVMHECTIPNESQS